LHSFCIPFVVRRRRPSLELRPFSVGPLTKPGTWNIPEHPGTFRNIPEHPGTGQIITKQVKKKRQKDRKKAIKETTKKRTNKQTNNKKNVKKI